MGLIVRSAANCKNCYKCVRTCPVKAVRFTGGQAEVVEELCLHCGECVLSCPQRAKSFVAEGAEILRSWLGKERIAVSLAPSTISYFPDVARLIARLKAEGAEVVRETAEGAALVAKATGEWVREHPDQPWVSTSCPVVVNFFEKHHPDLLSYLVPVVSPMVAHGRLLKKRFGEVKVIMIAPCPAKIGEARDSRALGTVDAVVTFHELAEYLGLEEQEPILRAEPGRLPEEDRVSRLYPLPGGMLPAAGEDLGWNQAILHGIDDLEFLVESLRKGTVQPGLIEALGCRQGCLGGFSFRRQGRYAAQSQQFLASLSNWPKGDWAEEQLPLKRTYQPRVMDRKQPSDLEIRQVLREIGKVRPEDELNCGACGYLSCREKAIAVCQGLAEVGMCMPYMESRAESLSNTIIEATPNAIILTDRELRIQEFNPAAEHLFQQSRGGLIGQPLDLVIPVDDFLQVAKDHQPILGKKVTYPKYGKITRQTIVWVEEHDLVLALIADITRQEQQILAMQEVKEETIQKAQEVIDKQMRTVQEIAGLLGETAAESKILLTQLMGLVSRDGGSDE